MGTLKVSAMDIAYKMMHELNGVGNIYPGMIDMCYESVCKKFGFEKNDQQKKEAVDRVRCALRGEEYKKPEVGKPIMLPANPIAIEHGSSSKSGRRNALGYIRMEDYQSFCDQFVAKCEEKGYETYVVESPYPEDYRITFSYSGFVQELKDLNDGKKLPEVGIFFERPIIGYEGTKTLKEDGHLIVWIYFTIYGKALTRFKKFILDEIVEIKA